MNSEMFKLNLRDVGKGLISAVIGAVVVSVFGVIQGVFSAPGLDVFSIDWATLGHQIVNTAVTAAQAAFVGYIGKNFLSTEDGKFMGKF